MPREGTRTQRGYGWRYEQLRAALLAGNPPCWWGCGRPATTADHVPPLGECGYVHYNLVPACEICNYGRGNKKRPVDASRVW